MNKYLFSALGIGGGKHLDGYSVIAIEYLVHLSDAGGLVFLNADHRAPDVREGEERENTLLDVLCIVDHRSCVACDIRLTLRSVNKKGVDRGDLIGIKLYRGGKSRAAESDESRCANRVGKLLEACDRGGRDRGIGRHLAVALNEHGLTAPSV